MHQPYLDIINRLGLPNWWDENGVPRYEPFHPRLCADIYADFAALISIRCQGCGQALGVSSTWGITSAVVGAIKGRSLDESVVWDEQGKNPRPKCGLPKEGHAGPFGYGDAPWHGWDNSLQDQCSGTTMTTYVVDILQFWHRENHDWVRDKTYEVHVGEDES